MRMRWNALCAALTFSQISTAVYAEAPETGLCEHHPKHTAECGYTEGAPGTPCNHEHTEDCYTHVTECVHEHTADCYPAKDVSGNTATPSNAEEQEPTACTHECSEESGCITKVLDCKHEHDEACGYYTPATEGTPCTYVCEICNPQDSGRPEDKPAKGECICTEPCTEDNINEDCPVCGAESADLTLCEGEAETATPTNALFAVEADNVTLTINGQQSVGYPSLSAAVNAIPYGTTQAIIKINSDLEENEYIPEIYKYLCNDLTIDCGGFTITGMANLFASGANITIQNGKISVPVVANGGSLNILDSNISFVNIISGTVNIDGGSIDSFVGSSEQIHYAVDSLTLTEGKISLATGETKQLTAVLKPDSSNGKVSVSWSSNNDQVASVSSNGVVTAVAKGSTVISATVTDEITGLPDA